MPVPRLGSGTEAGMEKETSTFMFKVAECLPHADEERVDGCDIRESATSLLLNFCFASRICGTCRIFFTCMYIFFAGHKSSYSSRDTMCPSH